MEECQRLLAGKLLAAVLSICRLRHGFGVFFVITSFSAVTLSIGVLICQLDHAIDHKNKYVFTRNKSVTVKNESVFIRNESVLFAM